MSQRIEKLKIFKILKVTYTHGVIFRFSVLFLMEILIRFSRFSNPKFLKTIGKPKNGSDLKNPSTTTARGVLRAAFFR